MSSVSYKSYQQVITLPSTKNITKAVTPPAKRRTKTGCLTCRKRKKKCDEEVSGGKCQGCTRNFLECCWPDAAAKKHTTPSAATTAPAAVVAPSTPVAMPLTPRQTPKGSPLISKAQVPETTSPKVGAYPSPEMSPVFESKEEQSDILTLELPKAQFKITKPKKLDNKKTIAQKMNTMQTKFVITSVEKRRLVHIE